MKLPIFAGSPERRRCSSMNFLLKQMLLAWTCIIIQRGQEPCWRLPWSFCLFTSPFFSLESIHSFHQILKVDMTQHCPGRLALPSHEWTWPPTRETAFEVDGHQQDKGLQFWIPSDSLPDSLPVWRCFSFCRFNASTSDSKHSWVQIGLWF